MRYCVSHVMFVYISTAPWKAVDVTEEVDGELNPSNGTLDVPQTVRNVYTHNIHHEIHDLKIHVHTCSTLLNLAVEEEKKENPAHHTTPKQYKHVNTKGIGHLGAQP